MKLGIADSKEVRGNVKEDKYHEQMLLLGKAFDERLFFEIEKKQEKLNMKGWLKEMPKPRNSAHCFAKYGMTLQAFKNVFINKRKQLLAYDRLACMWCACYLNNDTLTIEHIIPRGNGGAHTLDNMGPACYECNRSRDSNEEWVPEQMRFGESPRLNKEGKLIMREPVAA